MFWAWFAFTICALFIIVVKAVMSRGDEHHWWAALCQYWYDKPITIIFRFGLAQIFFFAVWDNPALVGDLLQTAKVGTWNVPGRWWLGAVLGFASDKLADLLMIAGSWAYRRAEKLFSNGNGGDPPAAAGSVA